MSEPTPLSDDDRADLVAYLDGELKGSRARALEARLQNDPRMRAEAETLRHTWDLLDFLPRPRASAAFASVTVERLTRTRPAPSTRRRLRPWALGVGWVAAVLLTAAAGFGGARWISGDRAAPPPPDAEPLPAADRRILDNLRPYETVGDVGFLRLLADGSDPDLFGDDSDP